MIKQKGKNTQITNIKKGGGDITTDATATERIKREYCEQLYSNTIDILVEMKKKNHKTQITKTHEERENTNSPITIKLNS